MTRERAAAMTVTRKAVLLRFDPELLERVDEARGLVERSKFLMGLITEGLTEMDGPRDGETLAEED